MAVKIEKKFNLFNWCYLLCCYFNCFDCFDTVLPSWSRIRWALNTLLLDYIIVSCYIGCPSWRRRYSGNVVSWWRPRHSWRASTLTGRSWCNESTLWTRRKTASSDLSDTTADQRLWVHVLMQN